MHTALTPVATERILPALAALVPDPAITRIVAFAANGDSGRAEVQAEITRGGRVSSRVLPPSPEELRELISMFLGPGQVSGPVAFQGFAGLAALPPIVDTPLLLLYRRAAARVTLESVLTDGLLTVEVGRAVTALLGRGSGVILAGPPRSRLGDVLSAIAHLLPASVAIAAVETGSRIDPSRVQVRLRELPAAVRCGLGDAILLIDLPDPPALSNLIPPVAIAVTARTPVSALARLRAPGIAMTAADAVAWAETAPLLIRYAHTPLGPRLESVWELQPRLDPAVGLPHLMMLLGTDPVSTSLIRTGAIPTDPLLRAAWRDAWAGETGRAGGTT